MVTNSRGRKGLLQDHGRREQFSKASVVLIVAACLMLVAVGAGLAMRREAASPSFRLGVTHTQQDLNDWNPATAVNAGRRVLSTAASLQNQFIMGFGALNPEPAPGVFDWSSLDKRVQLIRKSGGTAVITLCCAPDWMKGGSDTSTDWSKIDLAPTPDHFQDFAALAALVARRYPDVRYYQVWSELRGFYSSATNDWDMEGYTTLYNVVYSALKAVNSGLQVGGPYVSMDNWSLAGASNPSTLRGEWGVVDQRSLDALSYWLKHALGADFVTVDGGISTKDTGLVTQAATATEIFTAVGKWIRQRTTLPLWWGEFYVGDGSPASNRDIQSTAALTVTAVLRMIDGGADAALLWSPEADSSGEFPGLWTSTATVSGGQSTVLGQAVALLQTKLKAHVDGRSIDWNQQGAVILQDRAGTMLTNPTESPARVTVHGRVVAVPPWAVRRVE